MLNIPYLYNLLVNFFLSNRVQKQYKYKKIVTTNTNTNTSTRTMVAVFTNYEHLTSGIVLLYCIVL
jgi:hypothetical protein